jgi:hypothetical protein
MDHIKLCCIAAAAYERLDVDVAVGPSNALVTAARDGLVRKIEYVGAADVEAFTLWFEGVLVVAIRGTDALPDMIDDAMIQLKPFKTALVHAGFLRQFLSVRDAISHGVDEAWALGHKVVFTGHSSGAAVATLCACEFGGDVVGFGAPKLGDARVAALLKGECAVYVNGADPIPKLPLSAEYQHPAPIKNIGAPDRFPFLVLVASLTYHASAQYVRSMKGDVHPPTLVASVAEAARFVWGLLVATVTGALHK